MLWEFGGKFLLDGHGLDGFILLAEADVSISMQLHDVFGELVDGNGGLQAVVRSDVPVDFLCGRDGRQVVQVVVWVAEAFPEHTTKTS